MDQPYTPAERLNVGREDLRESGFWMVSHIDDPRNVLPHEVQP